MRAVDIIAKKRDGQALTDDEISWFVETYTRGDLPDYQASAFLMAVQLRGMTSAETTALTLAMARSGETLDLSDISDYVLDKHSSGGVGDKTSLLVLPLVASCGVPVAKMSGRGDNDGRMQFARQPKHGGRFAPRTDKRNTRGR